MAEHKTAVINISKALLNVSLVTLAAIGGATGIPFVAGMAALPAAVAASGTLRTFLAQQPDETLELPAPPSWTGSAHAWQTVGSSIEMRLSAIMDTVAAQLQAKQELPTPALIRQTLIQAIAQHLPTWEIPAQERGLVAAYLAPLLFAKTTEVLQPVLDQLQKDVLADTIVKVFALLNSAQQAAMPSLPPGAPAVSLTTMLEQKMQAQAYDVYISYHEQDEDEVLPIGAALKVRGILPWFDFLGKPGKLRRKEQESLIETIPTAAIFVGTHAIEKWQELHMYAFLEQFVERECTVIPVLLKSAPSTPKLPPFLDMLVWADFRRSDPDPLTQFIRGING